MNPSNVSIIVQREFNERVRKKSFIIITLAMPLLMIIQAVSLMLAMGAGMVGNNLAERIVDVFLSTEFEGGRRARRVDKIMALEG